MAWRVSLTVLLLACAACSSSTDAAVEDPASGGGTAGDGSAAGNSSAGSESSAGTGGAGSHRGGATQGGATQGGDSSFAGSFAGTSSHDQPACDVDFENLDKTCDAAEDCQLVQHQIDCCGTLLVMGIAATAVPGFSAIEQYCAAQFPPCGCASQGLKLEDGTLVEFGSTAYAAKCVDNQCRSRSTATTFSCGAELTCTTTQYCSQFSGGPAGSEPSYGCLPLGDCQDCACLNVEPACVCAQSGDAIKVSCFAP